MSRTEESIVHVHPGARRLLSALFAAYLVLLIWLVVWKLHIPYAGHGDVRPFKLVPFVGDGTNGASSPRDVLGNLLIFIPLGLFLGLLAPRWSPIGIFASFALASLALESAQWALAVGSFDVTDIIMNTLGGIIGFVLLALAGGRPGKRDR